MSINRLGFIKSITFSSNNSAKTSNPIADNKSMSNKKEICNAETANAIKNQQMTSAQKYKFLQSVNIPSLNLNGNLYVLPNGQKCFVAKKEGPTVLKTFFKVGSMNEPDHLRGISHYIEHNLFNGSKELKPTEFVTKVNSKGGNYNASTGFVATNYFIQSPLHKDSDLAEFIRIHADKISNPTFPEEMLEKEKGPVISEIQMLGDDPSSLLTNTVIKNLFGIKTQSAHLIGGAVENIQNITKNDVVNFYKNNYTPKDTLTVVIGEIDEKQTMDLLYENFKNFSGDKIQQYHEKLTPINKTIRTDLEAANSQSTLIQLGFAGPKNEENKTAINALVTALTGYRNAKLSDALRDVTQQINGQTETISNEKGSPTAILFTVATSENNSEEILKTIYQKIHEMSYIPLSEQELNVVKNKMKMALKITSESNISISDIIGGNFLSKGNFDAIKSSEANIEALTAKDIMDTAKKYLDLNKTSIAVVKPPQTTGVSFGKKINNEIKTYKTPNNAEITTQNIPNAKIYALNLRYILNQNPPKSALPLILSFMLEKGTNAMDEKTFLNSEDEKNIISGVNANYGEISYSYTFPKESLFDVMENINKRTLQPPITKENFEKAKQKIKNSYLSAPKEASNRAIETIYEGTPLAGTMRKTLEEIDSISFDDIVNYYNSITHTPNLKVTLTGNINDPNILSTLFQNISTLGKTFSSSAQNVPIDVKNLTETKVITEVQERNQADIIQMYRIKQTGNVKDAAAISLLNEILGGNSNSRLFNDLREKQKLAYRVKSNLFADTNNEGFLSLSIDTTTDGTNNPNQHKNLQKALNGFKEHINKLIKQKVSEKELEAAKLQLKSKIEFAKESTNRKNNILSSAMLTPYKHTYNQALLDAIENTTAEDIQKIAYHYLTKPSVISVIASNSTIKANDSYLKSLGNLIQY